MNLRAEMCLFLEKGGSGITDEGNPETESVFGEEKMWEISMKKV